MLRTFLNNYFGFNRQQRNGLAVLMFASLGLLLLRITYPFFLKPAPMVVQNLPLFKDSSVYADKGYARPERFSFDPNTSTTAELRALGLSEKTAATLIRYRKHHRLNKTEDLQKVYGISPRLYRELEPFITIKKAQPAPVQNEHRMSVKPTRQNFVIQPLNTADSSALTTIPGIGPVFARRIVKYRELLGGFVSKEQLIEVYGFDEERYSQVESHFSLQSPEVRKINLNTADFRTVNKHPYISYELTKRIFDWRRKTILNATNIGDVIADEKLQERLLPYLEF